MNRSKLKRPLLYSLVGSIVLGALLGILLILRNRWGTFEIRVLLTTVVVAIGSLCGLACDLSKTPRGLNLLPRAGLLLSLLSVALLLFGIWVDPKSDWFWNPTAIVGFFTVATVHVCLLSIVPLASRFRWVFLVACQVIYGLAMLLSIMLLWNLDNSQMLRFVAVVVVIDAALTLIIPILGRISRSDVRAALTTPLEERNLVAIDSEIAQLKKRIADLEKLRAEIS